MLTATNHLLPFRDLDPDAFERLCLWLLQAEGYQQAEHYGAAGADSGRDLRAFKAETGSVPWYFQCKRRLRITRPELFSVVEQVALSHKASEAASGGGSARPTLVFIATCLISATMRSNVRSHALRHGLNCQFLALTELDEMVKRHPRIVAEFFRLPPGWFVEAEIVVPRVVPGAPLRFVNRSIELARMDDVAAGSVSSAGPTVAVVSGLHGVGKTAFGRHWANLRRTGFTGGDLHADFSRRRRGSRVDPSEILADFLRDLGTADIAIPAQFRQRQQLFRKLTLGRRLLMLLDDVEEPAQALSVLPTGAGSVVLVTSNYRLPELLLEGAVHMELEPLNQTAARAVFVEAIGEDRVRREEGALAELLNYCAGLPIALSVCAARLAGDSHRTISGLLDRFRAENPLHALSAPKGFNIESVFDLAYAELPPTVARTYRRLGIHPGLDISYPATRVLVGGGEAEVTAALDYLHDAHLVDMPVPGRFRLHSLVREHMVGCLERDESDDERNAALKRLALFYLASLQAADHAIVDDRLRLATPVAPSEVEGLTFGASGEAFEWFLAARYNVLSMVRAARDHDWYDLVWSITETLWPLCSTQKLLAEIVESHEVALDAARQLEDAAALGRLYSQYGRVQAELGNFDAAHRVMEQARASAAESGNTRLVASVEEFAGVAFIHEGEYVQAIERFQVARELFAEVGRHRGVALQNYHLGWAYVLAGLGGPALQPLDDALTVFSDLNDRISTGRVLLRRGQAELLLAQDDAARRSLASAIDVLEISGVRFEQAEAYEALSESADRQRDSALAEAHLIRAYRLYREIGHPRADQLLAAIPVTGSS